MGIRVLGMMALLLALCAGRADATTISYTAILDDATGQSADQAAPSFPGFHVSTQTADEIPSPVAPASYLGWLTTPGGPTLIAESVVLTGLAIGEFYLTGETSVFPDLRGLFGVAAVPEPASLTLLGLGLFGVGVSLRAFSRTERAKPSEQ